MINLKDLIESIANAIRQKKKTTKLINPQNFPEEILSIEDIPETETGKGTPTKSQQEITPKDGKLFNKFIIEPIPGKYIDTSTANATSSDIIKDKTAYVNGNKITGNLVISEQPEIYNNEFEQKSLETQDFFDIKIFADNKLITSADKNTEIILKTFDLINKTNIRIVVGNINRYVGGLRLKTSDDKDVITSDNNTVEVTKIEGG